MMQTQVPKALLEVRYYQAAQDYLRKLPKEHFMEATPQATQRKITLESLDLVHARRPEVQIFNELLVQYPMPKRSRPVGVVPDNMVVIHNKPIKAEGSFDLPLQPVRPFWMLEYVSKSNSRKDYNDNMRRYEHELKVPYYLLFVPGEEKELTLYRHTGQRYVTVLPDEAGRCAIPELELAAGLHDGWLRFWYQGELLPLPADLMFALEETQQKLADMTRKAESSERRAESSERRAESSERRADAEIEARLALERELAQLRAQVKAKE